MTSHTSVDTGCGCGGSTAVQEIASPAPLGHYHPIAEPTVAAPPVPTPVYESAPTPAFGNGFRSDEPEVAADPPSDAWDAGLDQPNQVEPTVAESLPPAEPAPMPEPQPEANDADDLFGGGFEPEPQPTEEMPADDLFGDEPVAQEPEQAFDDEPMFGDEPSFEEQPAFGDEPAEGDDLFGEPAEEAPFDDAPMNEGTDDLFGEEPMPEEPAAEEPQDDLFGGFGEEEAADTFDEPAPPAEEPVGEEDLFGGFGDEPEAPAENMAPPAEEPAEDDLFGGFGEDEADDFGGDDLFDAAPEDAAPADQEAEDDLFDFGSILREPGGVQSVVDRTWVDNTGRFSTVGRLIAVDGGTVRLAKPGGGIATVPLGRLSQSDLQFVSRQAMAQIEARDWAIAHGVQPEADAPKQAKAADRVAPLRTAQL